MSSVTDCSNGNSIKSSPKTREDIENEEYNSLLEKQWKSDIKKLSKKIKHFDLEYEKLPRKLKVISASNFNELVTRKPIYNEIIKTKDKEIEIDHKILVYYLNNTILTIDTIECAFIDGIIKYLKGNYEIYEDIEKAYLNRPLIEYNIAKDNETLSKYI